MKEKMSPITIVIIVVLALNILGFLLELLVESAILALVVLAGYALYLKFIKKV